MSKVATHVYALKTTFDPGKYDMITFWQYLLIQHCRVFVYKFRGVFRAKYQLLASISLAVLEKQIYGDHTNPFNLGSTSFRFLADATHMFLPKFLTEENDCGGTISHAGPETGAALIYSYKLSNHGQETGLIAGLNDPTNKSGTCQHR